jgi:hypothetical protein
VTFTCVPCPMGQYSGGVTAGSCQSCPAQCATCVSSTRCTSCIANSYFNSHYSTCTACPTGTYSVGGTVTMCRDDSQGCILPCATCISPTSCKTCVANSYFNSATSSCSSCPAGSYAPDGTVASCTSNFFFHYEIPKNNNFPRL